MYSWEVCKFGPGYFNAEASSAYRDLSVEEREQLKQEAGETERVTVIKRVKFLCQNPAIGRFSTLIASHA